MSNIQDLVIVDGAEKYDFANCATRLDRTGPYNKTDVAYAIFVARGNFGKMAGLLGRTRRAVKAYVEGQPDLLEFRADLRESLVDNIEDKHLDAALQGDGSSQRYILSTLGKDRGYSQRIETTGADGKPIETSDPLSRIFAAVASGNHRLVRIGGPKEPERGPDGGV